MKHIEDLIWYDQAFLTLYRNDQNEPVLEAWVNVLGKNTDEQKDLYISIKCTEQDLQGFLDGKISLLEMERRSSEMYMYTGDIDSPEDKTAVTFEELEEYHPSEDSFYDREVFGYNGLED